MTGTASPVAGLGRDALWSAAGMVASGACLFASLAVAMRVAGPRAVGLYAVISGAAAVVSVADFALTARVTRAVARIVASRCACNAALASIAPACPPARDVPACCAQDGEHAREIACAAWVYRRLALAAAVLTVPASMLLERAARVTPSAIAGFRVAVACVGAAVALSLWTAALPGLAAGMRAYRRIAWTGAAGGMAGLLVVAILGRHGVVALAAAHLASVAVARAALAHWSRRAVPWARCTHVRPSAAEIRRLAAFAAPVVASAAGVAIVTATDVVVLGAAASATVVALYRVACEPPFHVAGLLFRGFDAALPALGRRGGMLVVSSLMRPLSFAAGAVLGTLALARADVVWLLAGRPSRTSETMLLALSAAWLCAVPAHGLSVLLIARDRHSAMLPLAAAEAGANLALTVVLVGAIGPAGVAWATLAVFAAANLVAIPAIARRSLGVAAFAHCARDGLGPMAAGLGVAAAAWMVAGSAPSAPARLVAAGVACAAVAAVAGPLAAGRRGRADLRTMMRPALAEAA